MNLFKSYGVMGVMRLIRDVVFTKLFNARCRIIRYPFYIRGAKHISFSKGFTSGVGLRLDTFEINANQTPKLSFGINCQVNDYVHIGCIESIEIGDDVLIASKVFITDHNHGDLDEPTDFLLPPSKRGLTSKKVKIGNQTWIGESVMILPGVSIGNNCIIGAGSVVTKNIPDYSVAVGNPAKVIKIFDVERNDWK
ncbi:DapH/DapD/GlmU-related protein [Vibrio atlanticus]|uniref:Acyl transferase n=1 Tax=Vibrio atlanticus (strain LGP32) TaxID=575788 RepID=B7VHP4_VIBA3|nr:DapH/DapD/GlmU-related protein [Vibrio atlanticus]CAV17256.1 putative acyl transferase [Vibrio atlanticus]